MNIFISCHLYYPAKLGGPANTLYWLANALAKSGHNVSVVTTHDNVDQSMPYDQWMILNDVRVFYSRTHGIINSTFIRQSKREINRADIVILNSFCFVPESILCQYALSKRKKIIWSPRGEFSPNAINKNLKKRLYFKLMRLLFKKNINVHVTSNDELNDTKRILGDTINIIQIPNLMHLPKLMEAHKDSIDYLLFLGRIAPIKALDKVICGLSLSSRFRESNIVFKIVGEVEPKYQNYYKKLITIISSLKLTNKVEFDAAVYGREKYELIRNAKALLLLSESENFGNVVIESLSQGTPVISSFGTPWEELNQTNAGMWIRNTPEDIACAIDYFITLDCKAFNTIRMNALDFSKKFNIDTNIEIWDKVFKTIK